MRSYIKACNDADAEAIAAHFVPDAVHYFPGRPHWSGAETIGANFAKRIGETKQSYTVDQVVTDAQRSAGVLEYTRFDPSVRQILRGVDWIVFDPGTHLIREIRPYTATGLDPNAARRELEGFDYAGRGYPVEFPGK